MLVMAATAWMLWQQRMTAIENAATNLRNLSLSVADQADRVITSVELAENRLLEHLARGTAGTDAEALAYSESQQLYTTMRDGVSAAPEVYEFLLADEHGNTLNTSHRWPANKLNLADRAYFQFAAAHPEVERFVSEAMISRQSGTPVFDIVRRLSAPDDTFKGVLLGSIRIDFLDRLFVATALAKGGSVSLFHRDGRLLSRYPAISLEAAQGHEAEIRAAFADSYRGVIRRPDIYGGTERLIAFSSLTRHPLIVAVSEPFSEVIAAWKAEAAWFGGIAVLGCLAACITLFVAIRRFRDHGRRVAASISRKVDEERKRAERESAKQLSVFGMALDNMNEGLLMFDKSNSLLLTNAAFYRIFGIAPEHAKPGMPVEEVIGAVARSGSLSLSVDLVIDFYLRVVRENVPAKFIRKLSDGRQLAGNFAPHDNGWIITYEDMTEMRKADERIAHMAHHDALTELPNRVMFRTRAEEALAAISDGGSFAIFSLDLDNFKSVNDTLGHPAGDKLLCETAKRIRSVIRPSDIVARLGGDEFAIVLGDIDSKTAIAALATRLVEAIAAPYEIDGQIVFVGTSIGIAIALMDGGDPDTLMRNADMALYRAKGEGRGRFAFFEPSMEQHVIERHQIGRELHNAMSTGALDLYYQPVVKVASRRIVGFEALLRWHHPTRGMISPLEFVPVAEENGLIVPIGQWALHRACLEAVRWPGDIKVAVNLSPVQFRGGNLVDDVAAALMTSGLAASRLELEITESTMMTDTEATIATLRKLKALGVHIAMDDFGTGYSSLAYLQKFPFDKVKIDRAFVRDIAEPTNLAIVRAIADIATTMGIKTLAEGVETEEQFARVADERCDEVQGYLFSPPRAGSEIAAMLARENSPVEAVVGPRVVERAAT